MSEKPKSSKNTAKDVEMRNRNRVKRKELAAELGELTLERAELTSRLKDLDAKQQQVAVEMRKL